MAPAFEAAVKVFRDEGVEAVAICLMNSILHGAHETRSAELIRDAMDDDVFVSCSHSVASIIGEFERGSTTVLNAYVARRTVGYLTALADGLAAGGMRVPLLLVQSNGGSISIAEVADRPVSLLLSGPAAGVGALSYYSQAIGTSDLISMEIGGTSCDVILMVDGKVPFSDHLDIAGYSYVSPSVEVHTVGAGGGTIARLDDAGLLQVGPEGAGARPGPSCYGLGGTLPTVTDAQVVLGRLKPGAYAGGAVEIDSDAARRCVADHLATPLGISIEDAAVGVIRLMEQKLLLAVQRLSTERGHDPRRFTLVGGGGAGPLHVAAVARALGCLQAYVPRLSGAFCALGMLGTDVRHDHLRVYLGTLDDGDHAPLTALFESLEDEALNRLRREGFTNGSTQIRRSLDLRYVGQQWDITVPVSDRLDRAAIRGDFDVEHDRLFGHTQPGGAIEITKARVTGIGVLPSLAYPEIAPATDLLQPLEHRPIWIDPETGWSETAVYEGSALLPGHRVQGPAIITEETTTVFLGKGDDLSVDGSGNFLLRLAGVDA
jgi:N-methylhydantoinase A